MLNLINLLISRAVDRLIDLVNLNVVRESAVEAVVTTLDKSDLVDACVEHSTTQEALRDITSRAVAKHIDLDDLADYIDASELADGVAGNVDLSEVADNIDLSQLAGEIDISDLAGNIDLADLAESIDYGRLATVVEAMHVPDDAPALEERINEAVSQAVASALDAAKRKTEPVVEQSPDLVTRLLDLAVEKLLARAEEAAKNGEV
jgi:hypothetical protein